MKKKFLLVAQCLSAAFFTLCLQGCLKDTCKQTYTFYRPVYASLTKARLEMKSASPQELVNTGKLALFGKYIFVNEKNKGVHIIDNSNPATPKNISFIKIPGNVDVAVKENYLYADSYSDIIVFDISAPLAAKPVKFINNVMKEKNVYWWATSNPDSVRIAVDYIKVDTTVDCHTYNRWTACPNCMYASVTGGYMAAPPTSTGGSMASFTIVDNYLYAVAAQSLYTIDIATPTNAQLSSSKQVGFGIETIYPFQNKLFIGSTNGLFIYSLNNPSNPAVQGRFTHAASCDPVIADGGYAYVTLRSGTTCNRGLNELDVIDINNLSAPVLVKSYPFTNPKGLSKDGDVLFICDEKQGLKVYDAADPLHLLLVKQVGNGLETFDVIATNKLAIVIAKDGLYQYDYTQLNNIKEVSKISITKN